jgi:anti-sigma factor ChrR (cupin superfamily)
VIMVTNFNMDFDERVVLAPEDQRWVATRLAGVERKMLEREGAETGRATSIVRYAPGSDFSSHSHDGGEEFIVLDGVFSDQYGEFGPGMYIRNPIGSEHRPFSKNGCTIFVKLSQFDPEDQAFVRLDTKTEAWLAGAADGLQVLPLHAYGSEQIALVRWRPGARFPGHAHPGGEEIFVLDGVFEDEFGRYPEGTWLRNPTGSQHTPFSEQGCTIYVKTGPSPAGPSGSHPQGRSKGQPEAIYL